MDAPDPGAAPPLPPAAVGPPGPVTAAPTPAAPPLAPRQRGWLGKTLRGLAATLLILGLVLGLLLPAGAVLALLHWPGALPWLTQHVPGLQVSGLQGTLGGRRVAVQSLDWQLPAAAGRLQIQGLVVQGGRLTWLPHPGAVIGLQLDGVSADQLQYTRGAPSGTVTAFCMTICPPSSRAWPYQLLPIGR